MDVREKLVEQLRWWSNECDRTNFGCQASKLLVAAANYIAHGVTVQEWISVEDRLPDTQEYDWVLVQLKLVPEGVYGVPCVAELRGEFWYDAEGCLLDTSEEGAMVVVTHWMPLPQPPKGE